MWTVTKHFHFEAAHSLPHLPKTHKCSREHGHSYVVVVICEGDLEPGKSWVVDYADIAAAAGPLIESLDHRNLNDIIPMQSTAENLAFWIFEKLRTPLPTLAAIEVRETATTNVIYRPYNPKGK